MKTTLPPALVAAALLTAPLLAHSQGTRPAGAGTRPAAAPVPAAAPAARPAASGRLTGTVTDAATGKPISYATVAVLDGTGKVINGGVCGDDGKFVLPGIPSGTYTVQVSFLGYKGEERPGVVVPAEGGAVALGTIQLGASAQALKEVVVTGRKQLIEERVDRTVYNADVDKTTAGGDATDVLKRVPLLSVDLDGNVSLRGSSNIRVLINNKPSTIAASSIADALKQIPADQIQTVEVITSPSAKYDAEGSGGIINIVTKTNNLRGGSLNVDLGAGLRASNLGLNGSYRTGKMGFSLGGFGRASYNQPGSFINNQTTRNLDGSFGSNNIQSADTRRNDAFGRYTLGWDYDIDKHNSLSASVAYGVRNSNNYQDLLTTVSTNPLLNSVRNVKTTDESGTVDASLNYTHTYETPQREFSILTLYSRNNRTNNFLNDILGGGNETTSRRRNDNDSYNQEMTAQLDYQSPTAKNQLLELGVKNIYRKVNSEYAYFTATGNSDNFIVDTEQRPNNFNYNQNVASGYATYTIGLPKGFTLKPGVRYEYTTISAEFAQGDNKRPDIPNYGVLVPSVNLSRKLDNGNVLKLAYNRRIQRPSLQFLNPNRQAPNPLQATQGNPELRPEYTNNYEIGYSTLVKQKVNLNMSAFVRNTTGSIQAFRTPNGDTIVTSFANIGKEDAYGASIFASANAGKLTLNGGVDTYYAVLNNNLEDPLYAASNKGFVINGRVQASYAFNKQWAIQGFSFFRGQQVQLQGYQSGFGIYSLNIRRSFADNRGGIGFGAENFFTSTRDFRNEINSPLLTQSSTNVIRILNFKVNISYRIGKLTVDQRPRNRRGVSNDDLKEGGDNGGGLGGGGGDTGGGGQQGGGGGRPAGGGQRPAGASQRPGGLPGAPGATTPTDTTKTAPAVAPTDSTSGQQPAQVVPGTTPAGQPGTTPAGQPAATPANNSVVKPTTPATNSNNTTPVNAPSPGTTSPGGITPAGSPGGRP
ncbi:TonB-dependent receptor [Hymenobacter sp. BT559]|nr:TonB-dependent receptor [Hymenobacter sp. BT559]